MANEIKPNAVYTTQETRQLLKVSKSTIKRLLKRELIKANKVGGQYRILGREILRLILPKAEQKAVRLYSTFKQRIKDKINQW